MRKHALAPLGIEIKTKLISTGQTQEWLIEQAKQRTGMYVDSSNLYKLMTGQLNSPKLEGVIKEILHLTS